MKNKTFDCVEMKRRAQERIYEEPRHLSPEQMAAHYRNSFAQLKACQSELRAKLALLPRVA